MLERNVSLRDDETTSRWMAKPYVFTVLCDAGFQGSVPYRSIGIALIGASGDASCMAFQLPTIRGVSLGGACQRKKVLEKHFQFLTKS